MNRSLVCRLSLAVLLAISLPAQAGIYDDILAAANRDDSAAVVDLLKRGMDVNTSDPGGNTLLMIAARNGNIPLLEFLLGNRANILKRNKFGDSAIMLAAIQGRAPVVIKLLAGGADIRNDGWNALHYAAYAGHAEVVRILLEHQTDIDSLAPNGQTALMLAASVGHLDCVMALIEGDADMDLEDYEGNTAIMLAQKAGHTAVVTYLRDEGAYE